MATAHGFYFYWLRAGRQFVSQECVIIRGFGLLPAAANDG